MLESIDMTTFSGRVGEVFRLMLHDATVLETRLIEVTPATGGSENSAASVRRTPFSLVFRSPPGAPLPQHIYRLEHDEVGVLELFLVPIGPDAHGMRYEAVFG